MSSDKILSLDLAIRPENVGVCMVQEEHGEFIEVSLPVREALTTFALHWQEGDVHPHAEAAARRLAEFVGEMKADVVVVDGPQAFCRRGFRRRRCESILRTPGSTGPAFGNAVRGYSWPAIARLGVLLFEELECRGWHRLQEPGLPQHERWAVEVFPSAGWHCFCLDGKTLENLRRVEINVEWEGEPNVHQLDAAIGALTVRAAQLSRAVYVGRGFFREGLDSYPDGDPREGYIVIPDSGYWSTLPL